MKIQFIIFIGLFLAFSVCYAKAQESAVDATAVLDPKPAVKERNPTEVREEEALVLFDDQKLLDAYAQKYQNVEFETLIQMLDDESLSAYQLSAIVRVFREKFLGLLDTSDKKRSDHLLLKCLNRSTSALVQVEVMSALVAMDRYKYFPSMIPLMVQKLDHYNDTVNELAFSYLTQMVGQQPERPREAQIVFNSLNKILFLSRNHLTDIKEPGPRLSQKLKLLRWSIKVLGTDDLDKLPKEVIGLL